MGVEVRGQHTSLAAGSSGSPASAAGALPCRFLGRLVDAVPAAFSSSTSFAITSVTSGSYVTNTWLQALGWGWGGGQGW